MVNIHQMKMSKKGDFYELAGRQLYNMKLFVTLCSITRLYVPLLLVFIALIRAMAKFHGEVPYIYIN